MPGSRSGGSAASSMASEAATDIERFDRVPVEDEIKRRSIELSFKAPSLLGRVRFVSIVPSVAVAHAPVRASAGCAARSTARRQSAGAGP